MRVNFARDTAVREWRVAIVGNNKRGRVQRAKSLDCVFVREQSLSRCVANARSRHQPQAMCCSRTRQRGCSVRDSFLTPFFTGRGRHQCA